MPIGDGEGALTRCSTTWKEVDDSATKGVDFVVNSVVTPMIKDITQEQTTLFNIQTFHFHSKQEGSNELGILFIIFKRGSFYKFPIIHVYSFSIYNFIMFEKEKDEFFLSRKGGSLSKKIGSPSYKFSQDS
jgi:hypothetical protein